MIGAVIGSYQLVRKLGEGGMGAVYLGQHTLLGRRAAIKVLLPALSARPDIVSRFFNEARAVTTISDPGIVQVFDFGYHSDGSAFIVMEFLEGEPLDRRLARLGRLPVADALRLCRQLASSLGAAHAQRIVHRDLKPENIFLVHDAEVASGERSKILDFGIAKLSDEQPGKLKTSLGALMGTPVYMSPEQCRGLADIDHRSDIYALGCVLFHLITGRPPFEGEGAGDIISAHIREPAPAPSSRASEIAPDVDAFVLRCLEKNPAARFQSMAALAAELGALLARRTGDQSRPAFHLLPTTKLSRSDMLGLLPRDANRHAPPVQPTPVPTPAPTQPMPALGAHPTPAPHSPRESTYPSHPPMPAVAIGATTLGSSAGQQTQHTTGPSRLGRWIAGGLVLGAVTIGIGIVSVGQPVAPVAATVGAPTMVESPAAAPAVIAPVIDEPPAPVPAVVSPAAVSSDAAIELDAPPPPKKSPARDHPHRSSATTSATTPGDKLATPAPQVAPPKVTPQTKPAACGKAVFAAIYNTVAPPVSSVRAALRTLRSCHDAGEVTDAAYEESQRALVSKL